MERQKTQWFNPPFKVNKGQMSRPYAISNSFGVPIAHSMDLDTAEGMAEALNLLQKLKYNPEKNSIGS